jgi:DNA polymerase III sliding clamp (beta) subunit (PCNA family)
VINRETLCQVLEKAHKAVGENSLFPVFQCFRIKDEKVLGTNGVCSILITSEEVKQLQLDCTVPAKIFLDTLRNLSAKDIDIEQEDGKLKISSGRVKGKFVTLDKTMNLPFPDHSNVVWMDVPDSLIKALTLCKEVASKDETIGTLCGVLIDNDIIYATDRHRAVRCLIKPSLNARVIMPTRFISILSSFADDMESVQITEEAAGRFFYAKLKDGTVLSTCLIEGDYPNLDNFFPGTDKMDVIEFVDSIETVLRKHVVLLKEMRDIDKDVKVVIEGNKCSIKSTEPKLAALDEEVDLKTTVNTLISFYINPLFLTEVSKGVNTFYIDPEDGIILLITPLFEYIALTKADVEKR